MSVVGQTFRWLVGGVAAVLIVSMVLLRNWPHAAVLLVAMVLSLPPIASLVSTGLGLDMPPWLRLTIVLGCLALFVRLLTGAERSSIYGSPDVEERLLRIYDAKMEQWPIPFDDVFLDTTYGRVHVVVSGPSDAPALLLLHASGVGSWSWRFNAQALGQRYRIYAVDLIGDAGKSHYADLSHVMKTGADQAQLYAEILEALGIERAFVVGASEGGFIATNLALHHPERVVKLVLLGPMGYSGAVKSVIRITIAQLFPLSSIQDSTFRWAFSDSAALSQEFGEWFRLLMDGVFPAKVAPLPISEDERRSLSVPIFFVFGERDHLVGDPARAVALVQDVPNAQTSVLPAGHLMGAELPTEVNKLVLEYFDNGLP